MKSSVMTLIFSVFLKKYPCLGKLFWKIKIVSSIWNLEPRLIRICRIRWWFSFFVFFCLWLDIPFMGIIHKLMIQKLKIVSLSWNLVLRLIWICRIRWWYSILLLSTGNVISEANLEFNIDVQFCCFWTAMSFSGKFNPENQNFSWNLVLRLILICRIPCWCLLFLFLKKYIFFGEIWSQNFKLFV